ncbi:TerD family protein [Nocardia donostiensis]|uniref:Tellerium resistance protein n=1 Tax=Nocardia donostiensis TaxID=1538463 RepID=A0A1V2T9P3_9NOCA|nr:tellerium resistance protein [Nocardia donostiensis]ONM46234.1 tellerium resistance protein [Nocardia donostiensis]OQS13341.1 tellerium resistance protein [Nocardia donostiensis]OQS18441.1 tellerium resistance protein [Nocardia donostiensis]
MAIDYTKHQATSAAGDVNRGADPNKLTLTKNERSVDLTKSGERQGVMRVNLNWTDPGPAGKPGFFAKLLGASGGIDLDLGCLYELADGSKGVVQALGNSYGDLNKPPFIALDRDDRTGAVTSGENLHINLADPSAFRRILVFAMIYEGAPNWAAVDGVVTMYPTAGPQIEIRLDSAVDGARICAVALLTNTGRGLTVGREVEYVNGGQADLDRAYRWGIRWAPGRK